MALFSVPIQRARARSDNNEETSRVLPSNSGVVNGFQTPCTNRCSPSPGPDSAIPAHNEPSALSASACTPSTFGLKPRGLYTLDEPGFQRTISAPLPIQ